MNQTENILAAKAHYSPMDGSPEWSGHLRELVEGAIAIIRQRGGDDYAARQAAVSALLEVAAEVAVHTIDCFTMEGEPLPEVTQTAMAGFANNARVQLLGAVTAYDLPH